MEYLDVYDENKNLIGTENREIVHKKALWHNKVHCWLYDKEGNIYFQIRHDTGTYYTTASGHVRAGETIKEAFGREIKEELGVNINYDDAVLVGEVPFKMDRINKDGSLFRDRVFANVYVYEFDKNLDNFKFDEEELDGLAVVNAKETKDLFEYKISSINATIISDDKKINSKLITRKNFLVNGGETLLEKYGDILDKVIELIK